MKIKKMFYLITVILIVFFITVYPRNNQVEQRIIDYINENYQGENVVIDLKHFTDFDWDRVMIFKYPTTAEEIENELGVQYEKSLDLTSGIVFVLNDEIVYDEVFENDYDGPPHFFIYPQSDINAKTNYRVFSKEDADFLGEKRTHENGTYYVLYPYENINN